MRFRNALSNGLANTPQGCLLGQIVLFPGNVGVGGSQSALWPAAGPLLSITTNTPLFSVLGTTFGGDGVTTFALPDLRAQAPNGTTYLMCMQGVFPERN